MNENEMCLKDGKCCDYHEGLCMATKRPYQIRYMKRCPFNDRILGRGKNG